MFGCNSTTALVLVFFYQLVKTLMLAMVMTAPPWLPVKFHCKFAPFLALRCISSISFEKFAANNFILIYFGYFDKSCFCLEKN